MTKVVTDAPTVLSDSSMNLTTLIAKHDFLAEVKRGFWQQEMKSHSLRIKAGLLQGKASQQ